MSTFGQETFEKIGSGITVSADGSPVAKAAGVTIAWSEVAAQTVDSVQESYDYVTAGEKYIRYGTVLVRILTATDATLVGKFVPYGTPAPSGGSLSSGSRGDWVILNRSVHENDKMSDHVEAIDGGRVFAKRLDVEDLGAVGNEVQTITLGAGNSGGTFTITFSGQTTGAIAYNATGGTVETALIALSNIGASDVTVTGGAGGPYVVTFAGDLANTNVPAMTTTPSLTGGANTATVTVTTLTGPPKATFEAVFPMITYVTEG